MQVASDAVTVETVRGPVEYRRIGRGDPVIFFHGGQGNALNTTFDATFDLGRYQLIIPSRPGYGRTPLGGNASSEDTARLIERLMAQLGIGPAALVSVSLGARPAIAFAALFPELTRSLVLASPITGSWMERADPRYLPARILYNPRTERLTWAVTRSAFALLPQAAARFFVHGISTRKVVSIGPEDIARLRDRIGSFRSYSGFLADLEQGLGDDLLAKVKCPTLILHSLNDASVSIDQARHAESLIENSELRLYDNEFGHFLWLGPGSDQVNLDIRRFVEGKLVHATAAT